MFREVLPAFRATLVLAIATGLLFPLAITTIANLMFKHQATGSLVYRGSKLIGSELLGQGFSGPQYFHSRPSAAGAGYAGEASGGTNLGPTSKKLIHGDGSSFVGVAYLVKQYKSENGIAESESVPVDAVSRSASGLDPHVSPANAILQAQRVAASRNIPIDRVKQLLNQHVEDRTLGLFGEPRINVLKLNIALDGDLRDSGRVANH